MPEFAVHVRTDARLDPDDEALWDALVADLADYHASLGAWPDGRLSAQLTVIASAWGDALTVSVMAVLGALSARGVTAWLVGVEVLTAEEFAHRLAQDAPATAGAGS